jgi:hypothetical protein
MTSSVEASISLSVPAETKTIQKNIRHDIRVSNRPLSSKMVWGLSAMNELKGDRLYVNLSATQTKRRLQGYGFGVKKVHSNGRNQAVIIYTATSPNSR